MRVFTVYKSFLIELFLINFNFEYNKYDWFDKFFRGECIRIEHNKDK